MARRGNSEKRSIEPDRIYQCLLVTRFINAIMKDGKKSKAEKIIYTLIEEIGLEKFKTAVKNVTPMVEVKGRRVGGATYQVPVEIKSDRGEALGIRFIINAVEKKTGSMFKKLKSEFIEAGENRGGAWKQKEETHRMAEANKAYSHYSRA